MKKVLFLDDEKDIIELYQIVLEDSDMFECVFYSSALLANEYLKENAVDLVVCDEAMRDYRGLDILKTMRNGSVNNKAIFYLASGNPDLDTRPYQELNCQRFFQKPFEVDEILVMIKKDLF